MDLEIKACHMESTRSIATSQHVFVPLQKWSGSFAVVVRVQPLQQIPRPVESEYHNPPLHEVARPDLCLCNPHIFISCKLQHGSKIFRLYLKAVLKSCSRFRLVISHSMTFPRAPIHPLLRAGLKARAHTTIQMLGYAAASNWGHIAFSFQPRREPGYRNR